MADDEGREPKLRYEDVPDLMETFADGIGQWYFDGTTLRVEFLVSRFDQGAGRASARTGRRRPVCRMVLTAPAAVEMINRCRQLSAALEKAGVLANAPQKGAAAQN